MLNDTQTREAVDSFNWIEQMRVWIYYLSINLGLKYWFDIKIKGQNYYIYPSVGRSEPDKIIGDIHYRFLWKNIDILSFSEFIGEHKEHGIYYYYQRFHDKIKIDKQAYQL